LIVRGARSHPRPSLPLHCAPSMTESVSPRPFPLGPALAAYTVSVATSTATAAGSPRSVIFLKGWSHPLVVAALQRAMSTANTAPFRLAT